MVRRRNLLIGAILALVAAAASLGHSWFVERAAAGKEARVSVVVVRRRVPAWKPLDRSLLELRAIPRANALPGVYRSLAAVAGRVTTVSLWPGEQVIKGRTAGADDPEGVAFGLGPGERGMIVPVEAGTARALHPGDWVDVVAVTPTGDGLSQGSRLVPGVRVLKVGGGDEPSFGSERWAMLAVSSTQAQTLALAQETGRLRLVLRGGPEAPRPHGANPTAVKSASSVASAVTGRPPGEPVPVRVEVIRGVEREAPGAGTGRERW